jgi:hypothetical protein
MTFPAAWQSRTCTTATKTAGARVSGELAPDQESLRQAVSQLTASLDRAGVAYDAPRFGELLCHFQDHGPWPAAAMAG